MYLLKTERNEEEILDFPFTCKNLHQFISSEQLWDFISEKVNAIGAKIKNKEEIEMSLWEIRKELNFIQSQFDLENISEGYEEAL